MLHELVEDLLASGALPVRQFRDRAIVIVVAFTTTVESEISISISECQRPDKATYELAWKSIVQIMVPPKQ